MKLIGIDFGSKRVGVAVSDEDAKVAFPRVVLANDNDLVTKIKSLCDTEEVATVVVGQSHNYAGEPNQIMEAINEFVVQLRAADLKVVFEPEFMTSQQASRLQGESDKLDTAAAALILQSYLDRD